MKNDVPHFTLLGRQALAVMKRLTESREIQHRERHQGRSDESEQKKERDSACENVESDLHHTIP